MFRDPIKQTLSHLAWVKGIGDPERRAEYNRSPDYIKRTVERINSKDIVEFLASMDYREKNFFDNCQTRYLLPFYGEVDLTESHVKEALLKLSSFDVIGITERFYESILLISFLMGLIPPEQENKKNISNKKFFIDIDNADEEIKRWFRKLTFFDNLLYKYACGIFERQIRNMLVILQTEFPDLETFLFSKTGPLDNVKLSKALKLRAMKYK